MKQLSLVKVLLLLARRRTVISFYDNCSRGPPPSPCLQYHGFRGCCQLLHLLELAVANLSRMRKCGQRSKINEDLAQMSADFP